ncbi:MAG: hypothetical protein FWF94_05845 [Oscillospiraceae bacterium]|nr:hypothetical protein [Oscillospiraceae bacterium]
MGTQFFWFYDILLAAILTGIIYRCARQGFAARIWAFVGVALAFIIALSVSAPIAVLLYDNWISPGVIDKINYTESLEVSEHLSSNSAKATFDTLRNADMSKALFSGKTLAQIETEVVIDEFGKAFLDLYDYDIDLSKTGIAEGDLSFFALDSKFALSKVNLGKLDISAADYAKYDLGDIILSQIISHRIAERAKANHEELNQILTDTMPGFTHAARGGSDMIALLMLNVINFQAESLETIVNDNLVRPTMLVPLKALIFAIVFALVNILATAVSRAARLVNAVPLVGRVNHILGGFLGVIEAGIVILLVCIGIRIVISLTGDNIILLNSMTIDNTLVFKHIYNISFIAG